MIKLFGCDQTSYVYEIVLIVSYVHGKEIEDKIKVVKFSANLPPGNSAVDLCGLPPWSLAVGTSAAVNGLTAVRHTYRRNLRREAVQPYRLKVWR